MTHRCAKIAVFLSLAVLLGGASQLWAQEEYPYTLPQVLRLIESGAFPDERIVELTRESCIGFRLDGEAIRRLRAAGASEELIERLGGVCVRLTTVVVTPAELEIEAGASGVLRARAMLEPDTTPLPNVVFEWSSEDTTVADVSAGGAVVGRMPGETRITATTPEGHSGSALVRVIEAAPEVGGELGAEHEAGTSGKSVAAAATLGMVVPGGGELYVGNTVKGILVMLGVAAGAGAAYVFSSEDTLRLTRSPTSPPDCDLTQGSCDIGTRNELEIEKTPNLLAGAAIAGVFWVYGLVDGIRSAKRSGAAPADEDDAMRGLSFELLPADGVRSAGGRRMNFTLLRIQL
jgi:hypothetical protein